MAEQFGFLILNAPERVRRQGGVSFAFRWEAAGEAAPPEAGCVIVAAAGRKRAQELLKLARAQSCRALLEVSSSEEAAMAGKLGFDGVVSKVPLESPVPLWGTGSIGPKSATAWYVAGAAGVVLDAEDHPGPPSRASSAPYQVCCRVCATPSAAKSSWPKRIPIGKLSPAMRASKRCWPAARLPTSPCRS